MNNIKQYLTRKFHPIIWGDLGRVKPVSTIFGLDRGAPIDRYYIEDYLKKNSQYITGRAVEVGETTYLEKYGDPRVEKITFIYSESNQKSDKNGSILIANFLKKETIPQGYADCLVATQVFNVIYEIKTVFINIRRMLKENGMLIATLPGICQLSRYDADRWGDYWRFTPQGVSKLLEEVFGKGKFSICAYGNAMAACCQIQGVAVEDLPDSSLLDEQDQDFPVIIGFTAWK